jgi:hypothetical protein
VDGLIQCWSLQTRLQESNGPLGKTGPMGPIWTNGCLTVLGSLCHEPRCRTHGHRECFRMELSRIRGGDFTGVAGGRTGSNQRIVGPVAGDRCWRSLLAIGMVAPYPREIAPVPRSALGTTIVWHLSPQASPASPPTDPPRDVMAHGSTATRATAYPTPGFAQGRNFALQGSQHLRTIFGLRPPAPTLRNTRLGSITTVARAGATPPHARVQCEAVG